MKRKAVIELLKYQQAEKNRNPIILLTFLTKTGRLRSEFCVV